MRGIYILLLLCFLLLLVEAKKKHGGRRRKSHSRHDHRRHGKHGKHKHGHKHGGDDHEDDDDGEDVTKKVTTKIDVLVKKYEREFDDLSRKVTVVVKIGGLGNNGCYDGDRRCSQYRNYCSSNRNVRGVCRATCRTCATCEDFHSRCAWGKRQGYCTGSKPQVAFMMRNCKKMCSFCGVKPNVCSDKQPEWYCRYIRQQINCRKTSLVLRNCPKTCGYCEDEKKKDEFKCGIAKQREKDKGGVIVGGVGAKKGYYPWQAALYYENKFVCGGTLVTLKNVITAAHCFNFRVKDMNKYKVVLGEHNREYEEGTEQWMQVSSYIIHEYYRQEFKDHDIAVITFTKQVKVTDQVNPACLPTQYEALDSSANCYITGWGRLSVQGKNSQRLQELNIPIATSQECNRKNTNQFDTVTNKMICAGFNHGYGFQSGCHGDSGGPLSCKKGNSWVVYGVVSWGSPQCNGLDRYTVFTKVSSYIPWIKKHIK